MVLRQRLLATMALALALPAEAFDWECDLFCYNGGRCKHGSGSFGSYTETIEQGDTGNKDETEDLFADDAQTSQVRNMYCECPPAYTGLQCEIRLKMCEESQTCSNGSPCKHAKNSAPDGRTYFHCECDAELTDFLLHEERTEKYCSHMSRVFCDVAKGAHSSVGASESFCMNGGRCLAKDDENANVDSPVHHLGCECTEPYYGSHCEHLKDEYKHKGQLVRITETQKRNAVKAVGWAVAGLLAALVITVYARRRQQLYVFRKRRSRSRSKRYPPPSTGGSAADLKHGATYA